MYARFRELAATEGHVDKQAGDFDGAYAKAPKSWKPCTNCPSPPTPRWNRRTRWPTCRATPAKSGRRRRCPTGPGANWPSTWASPKTTLRCTLPSWAGASAAGCSLIRSWKRPTCPSNSACPSSPCGAARTT
jgi:hypothetical protein